VNRRRPGPTLPKPAVLLALYPRGWRDRYGAEVADLAEELISAGETTPLRTAFGLVTGAAVERWRSCRSRLAPAAVATAAACAIALAVSRTLHGAGVTRPYFLTHQAGLLLPFVEAAWLVLELTEFVRGRRSQTWRGRAARPGRRGYWLIAGACAIATTLMLYLAPPIIPGAAIRPGGAAFAAGVAAMIAGLSLRGWSFRALGGRYFNFGVLVSPDQAVITTGPYRLLCHPGSAGFLLICMGFGLASANWVALAAMTLLPLAMVIWRIRTEENALLATLGDRYRCYAARHRRLVPLIW
jgi:protein-S-isoprenylcysteine O-methyltransferase Ste14